MIEEASTVRAGATVHCDLCVIGAGAAGIAIADALQGSGLGVVLLESGGHEPEEATQALYRGRVEGAPQFPLDKSRLRLLGGTTNHWAGTCRPFDPSDFALRDWVPGSGWPLDRAALDPDYAAAHAVCDLGPYDYSATAWPGVGEKGPRLADETDVALKIVQHKPTRFAEKFAPMLRGAHGPRVLLHANAFELVPDRGGRTVERVHVRSLDGHRFDVVARRFVVAAGGIENARLLLLSDRIVPGGIGNASGLLGRYFMDHPGAIPFGVLLYRDRGYRRLAHERRIDGIRVGVGLSLTDAALERRRLLNHAVYMRPPMPVERLRDFEWFLLVQAVKDTLDERDLAWVRFVEALSARGADAGDSPRASICWIRAEQAPNPESRVRLGDELDALGQRRVVLDWRLATLNRRTFVEAAHLWARIFTRSGIGRVKLVPWLVEDDESWWRRITPGWHHMGTTRMSADPASGVVDPSCRVHGVDNLYVAGASVFPTSSYINPTLTLVALALRLARQLRADLGAGQGIRDEAPARPVAP